MRRIVFECPIDGFRTSPLVFMADGFPLGVDVASIAICRHSVERHASMSVRWGSVDMPEGEPREEGTA